MQMDVLATVYKPVTLSSGVKLDFLHNVVYSLKFCLTQLQSLMIGVRQNLAPRATFHKNTQCYILGYSATCLQPVRVICVGVLTV